ncbi:DUF6093 family protein [Arthrobacter sp. SAFR-014]|uniref:DUF6093 family protein n=1 Tax=unclassified Arthrobacter TaxID=235627 RepID=UPI003F7BC3D5
MSPLPNTRVVPAGWAEHHRKASEGFMTSPGTVHRISDGPPPYPKPVGWTGEALIHEALFSVEPLNREGGGTPAEQPTTERQYQLTTKVIDAPAFRAGERGDIVRVIGREFRIVNIKFGSQLWEIDLICVDNLTQQNPD